MSSQHGDRGILTYLFTCLLIQIQAPPLISYVSLGKSLNLSVLLFPLGELRNSIKTIHFTGVKIISQSSAGTRRAHSRCFGCCQCHSCYAIAPSPTCWNIKPKRANILHLGDLVAGQKMPRSWLGPSSVGCLSLLFSQSGGLSDIWYCFFFPLFSQILMKF